MTFQVIWTCDTCGSSTTTPDPRHDPTRDEESRRVEPKGWFRPKGWSSRFLPSILQYRPGDPGDYNEPNQDHCEACCKADRDALERVRIERAAIRGEGRRG